MNGKSTSLLEVSNDENQQAIKWYYERRIHVEVNKPFQCSSRNNHDSLAVATFYFEANNAKKMGVK